MTPRTTVPRTIGPRTIGRRTGRGRRARRRSQGGFTLVEMMVALVAGLIAIGSIYYVSSVSADHFHEQQRIAQSQMSLRMAIEQVRRDFGRAAMMGTPASAREQTCPTIAPPPIPIQGIQVFDGGATAGLDLAAVNNVQADRVLLTGNYLTSDFYELRISDAAGRTLFLRQDRQSFRRTFNDVATAAYIPAAFADVFRVGRMLHVKNQNGFHFFTIITGVNAANASVTINPAINPAATCQQGQGMGGLQRGTQVAPLNRIEYTVLNVGGTAALATLDNPLSPLAGVRGPALVRREVQFDGAATPIAGTERVVMEYVAEFDVDLMVDTAVAPGVPPNLQRFDDLNVSAISAPGGRAFAVRSALIALSSRSAAEDSRFAYAPRPGAAAPLTHYELSAAAVGAARVRTLRTEVVLPNLVNRGLR